MPRRPKKGKSNSLLLRKLVQSLDPTEAALVRERLFQTADSMKKDLTENPDKYKNGIITPKLIEGAMDKVLTTLAYESDNPKEKKPHKIKKTVAKEKEAIS